MEQNQISAQLRKIIKDCGLTRYALSKATGVDQGALSRFLNGKCLLSLESVDALAEVLELQLTAGKKKGK